jgi:hypothetical protein
MRTTLEIEDDVLEVAKGMAKHQCVSLGKAVSLLMRKAITPSSSSPTVRNGLRVISRQGNTKPVTLDVVNQLRDE